MDLPNLLLNVWSWGTPHDGCVVCTQYRDWCVELARERWLPYYIDFDIFIEKLKKKTIKNLKFSEKFALRSEIKFMILLKEITTTIDGTISFFVNIHI